MTFSETLSWTRHTDNIVHAASTKIGLLRRLRKRLSPLIIRQLYLTCIRPSLEYANVAWCGLTMRDQERLEKCNRSAARLITQTMPSSDIPHDILLARAGIPTLLSRRQVAQVKLAFTATRDLLPAHLQATFSSWTVPSSSHAMAQRNPCIRLPRPRKDTQRNTAVSVRKSIKMADKFVKKCFLLQKINGDRKSMQAKCSHCRSRCTSTDLHSY